MSKRVLLIGRGTAAIAALAIAGCGGGSGGGGENTEPGPTTKAAAIKQLDRTCAKSQKKVEAKLAVIFRSGDERSKVAPKLVGELFVPEMESQIDTFEELNASGAGAKATDEAVSIFEEMIEQAEGDPTNFVGQGSPSALKRARAYGFKVCGSLI